MLATWRRKTREYLQTSKSKAQNELTRGRWVLAEMLKLKNAIKMECYDISNKRHRQNGVYGGIVAANKPPAVRQV